MSAPARDVSPRGLMLLGAAIAAVGLVLAGTVAPRIGVYAIAVGWIVGGYGLHRFGRLRP